jgi:5-methylcytosine-specific restriction endonuclease McrA
MSRTVDHLTPLAMGGNPLDRDNCRLMHRRCNTIRSNQMRAAAHPRERFTVDVSAI